MYVLGLARQLAAPAAIAVARSEQGRREKKEA
jgi:hypothetical protein